MDVEERAAGVLNVAMFTILGLLALALCAYLFASHLAGVREIYVRLSADQKRDVVGLGNSAAMLVLGVTLARNALLGWRKGRIQAAKSARA